MSFPIYRRQQDAEPGWHTEVVEPLLQHEYIEVDQVHISSPGRPDGVPWTLARRRNAIVVAPRLADGRLLLIRQERYPIQRTLWEFPAGMIDDHDSREEPDTIERFTRQELAEETAHCLAPGGRLEPLGYYFSSPGFWDEHAYLFLATEVEPLPHKPELGEGNETIHEARAFEPAELTRLIAEGRIIDANTLALYARLVAQGSLELRAKS